MDLFVDRQQDMRELDLLLKESARIAQLAIVHGRRRVGKTTLLFHWARQTGHPYFYWVARRESPSASRQSLVRALWRWADRATPEESLPQYSSWEPLFEDMSSLIGDQPVILILDEFSYAVESDPSLPSHLQAFWDQQLKHKPIMLILAGSHSGMMVDLLAHHAPLYGRATGQLRIDPLPFAALADFFPHYPADERVATYAVVGGIPAYLERLNPRQSLGANIRQHLFQRTGMFRSEPALLIGDLVREPRSYEAILQAIAYGSHTVTEIAQFTGTLTTNASSYLQRLQELHLVQRRIPATTPRERRKEVRGGRYYLHDHYLRFYYRFVEPNLELIEEGAADALWKRIKDQFRGFVALTFEEVCREWVREQGHAGKLSFLPEVVGSHWSADVQVDVVAINWQDRALLLGECKWGQGTVDRAVVRELIEDKTPRLLKCLPDGGAGWNVGHVFFARSGYTEAARAAAEEARALLVDLKRLDPDLRRSLEAG